MQPNSSADKTALKWSDGQRSQLSARRLPFGRERLRCMSPNSRKVGCCSPSLYSYRLHSNGAATQRTFRIRQALVPLPEISQPHLSLNQIPLVHRLCGVSRLSFCLLKTTNQVLFQQTANLGEVTAMNTGVHTDEP